MDKLILEKEISLNRSQREIAKSLKVSQSTVKYWLKKHGLSTVNKSPDLKGFRGYSIELKCKKHNLTTFKWVKSKNRYICKKCETERTTYQRRMKKVKAIALYGNKCSLCGYDKCIEALEFHHVVPKEKDFQVFAGNRSWSSILKELKKCILVCANCHREIHYKDKNS